MEREMMKMGVMRLGKDGGQVYMGGGESPGGHSPPPTLLLPLWYLLLLPLYLPHVCPCHFSAAVHMPILILPPSLVQLLVLSCLYLPPHVHALTHLLAPPFTHCCSVVTA
jgi:hypothetical protein